MAKTRVQHKKAYNLLGRLESVEIRVKNKTAYKFDVDCDVFGEVVKGGAVKLDAIEITLSHHPAESNEIDEIDEYDFSIRTANVLYSAGIKTFATLALWSERMLREQRGCNDRVIDEIRAALRERHLNLSGTFDSPRKKEKQ